MKWLKKVLDAVVVAVTANFLLALLGGLIALAWVMDRGLWRNVVLYSAVFVAGCLVLSVAVRVMRSSWHRWYRPRLEVAAYGGESVSLTLCPGTDGTYYGTGWIAGVEIERRRPFSLNWDVRTTGKCAIRASDRQTVLVAGLEDHIKKRVLCVYGDGSFVHVEVVSNLLHREYPTRWIRGRVEIRADHVRRVWNHRYRFRLVEEGVFEIELVAAQTEKWWNRVGFTRR